MRSPIHSSILGRELARRGPLSLQGAINQGNIGSIADQLRTIGINVDNVIESAGIAMDTALVGPAIGNLGTPAQFLQAWMVGIVRQVTQVRVIDELLGVQTIGSWEDEEVVQTFSELTGKPELYGDASNIPLANYNATYERRTIVRLELGANVGILEEKRAAKANISMAPEKRAAVSLALDIQRNRIGFFGFNVPDTRTYGLLNEPNLPAYVNVPAGVGGTTWPTKTFLEITADLRKFVTDLTISSGGTFRPASNDFTITLPLGYENYLGVTDQTGVTSVQDWFTKTYPRGRIVTAPEFIAANGGANVAYIWAENLEGDESTDDGKVIVQMVPSRFESLGTEKRAKSYVEDYTNAMAGVMVKRPFAIRRYSAL